MNVGKRIQSLRRARGMSQEALAEQIGITRQTISKWELGQSEPDIASLLRLGEIFGVTVDDLIDGREAPAQDSTPPVRTPEAAHRRLSLRLTASFLFLLSACCMAGSILLYRIEELLTPGPIYYDMREFLPVLGALAAVWGTELLCVRKKLLWVLLWSAWIVVGGAGLFLVFAASAPQQVFISHLMNGTAYWAVSLLSGIALAAISLCVHLRRKKSAASGREEGHNNA